MATELSIIVPVYNAKEHLPACVDALLAQLPERAEIILVDDGSTDGSGELCDGYAAQNGFVRVLHQENLGAMRARKTGLGAAQGRYVTFADADDVADAGYYAALVTRAGESGADIVCCGFVQEERADTRMTAAYSQKILLNAVPDGVYEGKKLKELYGSMVNVLPYYTFGIWPSQWSKIFRRETVYEAQMQAPDEVRAGDDACVVYAALLAAQRVVVANDLCGYHYRMQAGSITHSKDPRYYHRVSVLYRYLRELFQAQEQDISALLMPQLARYRMYLVEEVLSLKEEMLLAEPDLTEDEIKKRTLLLTGGAAIFDGIADTKVEGVSAGKCKRTALAAKGDWKAVERSMRRAGWKGRVVGLFRGSI